MGLLSDVFTNRYDVESSINNAMNKTAMSWGQLDPTQYAPMTASTALQGDMYGRSLGYMLGGQDPLMKKQELIDQLMSKHPDPRTKEDLMAVARDAAGLGLYSVQAEILDIVSEMPDKEKASKEQINALLGSLRLTQGADPMIDKYLATKVDPKVWEEAGDEAREKYRSEIRGFFDDIISGYGLYLATQGLEPSDINSMMFENEGQMKNISMFMEYLNSVKANPFAAWLLANNDVLLASMGVNKNGDEGTTIIQTDGTDIIGEGTYLATIYNDSLGDKLVTEGDNRNDYDNLSKKDKSEFNSSKKMDMVTVLNDIYSNFMGKGYIENRTVVESGGGGLLAEEKMSGAELTIENQDDAIQAWIHPWWATGVLTARGDAMKYFLSKPPAEFEKFKKNPKKYFIENILRGQYYKAGKDGILGTDDDVLIDPEIEIPVMWGIQD